MNAYVSYICNDNYLPGIVALIKSLKYHKCKNEIYVMVTKDVSLKSKEVLSKLGVIIKEVNEIHYKGNKSNLIEDRYGKQNKSWMMFTKINIWKEIPCEKLLYIDSDMVVLQNIDSIFEINSNISAVYGGSAYHKYQGIEAGVLLIKPSIDTYNNLIKAMNSDDYDLRMSDQTLINDYFLKHDKINYLDPKFNRLQKKNNNIDGAYIYHWNGQKPWNINNVPNFNIWNFYYNL
jgi:glycogenin